MICMFDCPSAWFRLGVLRSLCWLRLLICGLLSVYSWFGLLVWLFVAILCLVLCLFLCGLAVWCCYWLLCLLWFVLLR